jgi:hypothetical protein
MTEIFTLQIFRYWQPAFIYRNLQSNMVTTSLKDVNILRRYKKVLLYARNIVLWLTVRN